MGEFRYFLLEKQGLGTLLVICHEIQVGSCNEVPKGNIQNLIIFKGEKTAPSSILSADQPTDELCNKDASVFRGDLSNKWWPACH